MTRAQPAMPKCVPYRHMNLIRRRREYVAIADERLRFQTLGRRFVAILGGPGERKTRQEFRSLRQAQAFARAWVLEHPQGILAEFLRLGRVAADLLAEWDRGEEDAMIPLHDFALERDFEELATLKHHLSMFGWPSFYPPGTRVSFALLS